jgi:hypothetical protein
MKKYFAIMVAVLFLFGVAGAGLAQQAAPSGKQDVPAKPIDGKKTEKSEKRQAVTPEGGGSSRDRRRNGKARQEGSEEVRQVEEAPGPDAREEEGSRSPRDRRRNGSAPGSREEVTLLHPDFASPRGALSRQCPSFQFNRPSVKNRVRLILFHEWITDFTEVVCEGSMPHQPPAAAASPRCILYPAAGEERSTREGRQGKARVCEREAAQNRSSRR